MPHLLKEYAKSLGVKSSKPIIKDHFFPITFDKYITISNDDNTQSKDYGYYSIVFNLLRGILNERGIKIIQLGGNSKIDGVDMAIKVSFKQQSFIISKSILHLGSDGVLNHTSSAKNIPTISIFGNTLPEINKPLFSSSAKTINLCPEWDKKPCYDAVDPKKQINKVKPEVVAQSILDLLNIKTKIDFNTLYVGNSFNQAILEIVPTKMMNLRVAQNQKILLRADYGVDENVLIEYCQKNKVSICSNKIIQPHGLQKIGQNIEDFFIFMDSSWDTIPDKYFRIVKGFKINLVILCEDKKDVPILRNKYFDMTVNQAFPNREKRCDVSEKSKFISHKRIVCDDKEYLSYAHFKKGLDRSNVVLDTPEYWRESDHFYIYDTDKNSQEKSL